MRNIKFFIFLLILSNLVYSQIVISKYAGEFMSFGVGARTSALGGAFTALANDVSASVYNPAGLAQLNYPQILLQHEEKFGKLLNYDVASVAIPYGKDYTFGITLTRNGIDGIYDTRNALIDANGDGKLDITNDRLDPDKITQFSNTDYVLYLSYAQKYFDDLYIGANIKFIRRDIAEFSATGIGFDISALYFFNENLKFGATLKDPTTTLISWSTGRNELVSPTLKFGTIYSFELFGNQFSSLYDVDVRFENRKYASQFNIGPISFDSHLGIEYNIFKFLNLRAGYSDIDELTFGIGVLLPRLNIDYSYTKVSSFSDNFITDSHSVTHRISVIINLNTKRFLR
jgi:hypothetical protein